MSDKPAAGSRSEFYDNIVKVHASLLGCRNAFNECVKQMQVMEHIYGEIKEANKCLVLDKDANKEIDLEDITDEGFVLCLKRIGTGKNTVVKLDAYCSLIHELFKTRASFLSKIDKMTLTMKQMNDSMPEYHVTKTLRTKLSKTVKNIEAKIDTAIGRYLKTRRSLFNRILGISEQVLRNMQEYGYVADSHTVLKHSISDVVSTMANTDAKMMKEKR